MVRRVGIIGFGHVGQYLVSCIQKSENLELAFVWNRTQSKLEGNLPEDLILQDLSNFSSRKPDLVVEVCHPSITKQYGSLILQHCDLLVGSPTVFSDPVLENELRKAASKHAIYVPSGAFWGGEDIKKMADSGNLKSLKVTMKFNPSSLKLEGRLKELNSVIKNSAKVIYKGPVREVCSMAPQNTNTMAAAALAGHTLGFDGVIGCLISDPNSKDYHVVEIEVEGFPRPDGSVFSVQTVRKNPAKVGEVSGTATYAAYFSSLKRAEGKSSGIHLC